LLVLASKAFRRLTNAPDNKHDRYNRKASAKH
jgi:hypothetical protein